MNRDHCPAGAQETAECFVQDVPRWSPLAWLRPRPKNHGPSTYQGTSGTMGSTKRDVALAANSSSWWEWLGWVRHRELERLSPSAVPCESRLRIASSPYTGQYSETFSTHTGAMS